MNRRLACRLLPVGVLLAWMVAASHAQASTVLLVRPVKPDTLTAEALVRMHGELVSAGFDVSFAAPIAGINARASLAMLASGPGVDAVVAILGDGAPDAIEVWVVDRASGKSVIRRTPYQPGGERDAEVLAIRAIELFRASLLEVDMVGGSPSTSLAKSARPILAAERAREPGADSRWALEFGGGVVTSFDGVGPAIVPMIRFDGVVAPWCVTQFVLAGLGTPARVSSGGRTALVSQEYSLAGVSFRWPGQHGVRPVVTLGAGVMHTTVQGHALFPYEGQSSAEWSFLGDVGVGMHLALDARFELGIEAHVQFAEPYPVLQFVGADVASMGHPTLLLTLALVTWL